jgi:NTP pyrophosphatase (non-canonical NTP hydrolase)
MNELDQIRRRIRKFRDARDWMQFHSPKNLACSISIEANELLEHFQWSTPKESLAIARKKKTEISHEIADVAVYLIELADNLGIDLAQAIAEKMAHNEAKYPADKVRGSSKKYTEYKTAKRLRK